MASIFSDPRFLPYLQATPMSGRIAEPVSLFTRYVPPVVEEEPEEEEVAQAPLAPVAPVYYPRPQPVDQGGGYDMPEQQSTGSGNFFTDLKGLVSPVTDLFAPSTPEVMSDAELESMVRDALDNPTVSQGAPVTPVTLEESTEYRLGQPVYDPNQDLGPFASVGETPAQAAQAAPQTGEVNPATVGVTNPNTGVTVYGDGFMTAPAPDPYEPGMLDGVKGLFGYPDDRTYTAGRFNALGEDTTREGYEQGDRTRNLFSQAFAYGVPMIGGLMGGMIAGTRLGAEEGPYGRDGAGNYRFNAPGPMGTVQSPYGVLNLGPAYGRVATNDYSGLYGLGTVGNTGRSATDMMFDDVGYKGGQYGYGIGFKADGSFGSLDEFDVLDYAGMYENAVDFSFGDLSGGDDGGGGTLSGDDSWSGIDGYL